jgi:hypothetical protein
VTVCAYGIAEIFFRALEQSAWKTRKAHMFFRKLFLQALTLSLPENRRATRRDGALLSV